MNVIILFFSQIIPILQAILLLAALVGGSVAGVYVFKGTKRSNIVQIQNDTIIAMQQQIDALKEQNTQQQKELDQQEKKIDGLEDEIKNMREALEDEGISVTVDDKKVTIKDTRASSTTKHIVRKPTRKTPDTSKKVEE